MDSDKKDAPEVAEDEVKKASDEASHSDNDEVSRSDSDDTSRSDGDDTSRSDGDKSSKSDSDQPVQQDSADALSKTPDEIEEDRAAKAAADTDLSSLDDELPAKKLSLIRRIWNKINIYFLIFIVLLIVAGGFVIVSYLNSQKPSIEATIDSQSLTTEALQQLNNTDATVGNSSQTLTIQGNAVIAGQTLTRGNLNVAGNLQTGGSITGPTLTISGATNLGDTQINSLQVAQNTAIQGSTTMRDLSVSGSSTFNGTLTASQITVSRLILSGNATLEIPNHISFTGASPRGNVNYSTLGNGGSANISGSDTAGTININSGNNPAAGCFIQVTFQQAYSKTPHVIISPVGSAAGKLQYYVERNSSGFSICSSNATTNNQNFGFDYFITY